MVKLLKNVIIAYTDICAASSRSLLGLVDVVPDDASNELKDLCGDVNAACVGENIHAVSFGHCKKEQVSVVIINCVIADENMPTVLNRLMDLCSCSKVERIYIPTVLRVELPSSCKDAMYENSFHGQSVFDLKPLPEDLRLSDPFILTLMPLIQIESIATSCLIIPGYRAKLAAPNDDDGSLAAVKSIQNVLARKLGLKFDLKKSETLVYKGKNEPDDDPVTTMYS